MRKEHREGTVGPWAKHKLDALEAYLEAYMNVMKNQPFDLVFVDAFAGLGLSRLRRAGTASDGMEPLIEDADRDAADEFIRGSPLRALGLSRPFDRYHFIDSDPVRVKLLAELKARHPDLEIRAEEGDANARVQAIAAGFGARWNLRGVAFLDPYGAHLHWQTVEALAKTGKFDVIINFPLDMAINRLLKRNADIPASWRAQLDLCFGSRAWFDQSYEPMPGLFGDQIEKRPDARDRLLTFYVDRLLETFGNVAGPSLVSNTQGKPLYHLIWASSNARGQPIAKHILGLGQAISLRRASKPL